MLSNIEHKIIDIYYFNFLLNDKIWSLHILNIMMNVIFKVYISVMSISRYRKLLAYQKYQLCSILVGSSKC